MSSIDKVRIIVAGDSGELEEDCGICDEIAVKSIKSCKKTRMFHDVCQSVLKHSKALTDLIVFRLWKIFFHLSVCQ